MAFYEFSPSSHQSKGVIFISNATANELTVRFTLQNMSTENDQNSDAYLENISWESFNAANITGEALFRVSIL